MANRDFKKIKRTIQDFSLNAGEGNGGGSVIVDALPANGVEGQTYLLRKTAESETFKVHCYKEIWNVDESNAPYILTSQDGEIISAMEKALYSRLNPELSDRMVNFDGIIPDFEQMSQEEFDYEISRRDAIVVQTEGDVLNLHENHPIIFQDLGEIGIDDLIINEYGYTSELVLAEIFAMLPNFLTYEQLINDNNEEIYRYRQIIHDGSETATQIYSFGEWEESSDEVYCVGTLTDTYEYDYDTLITLKPDNFYRINLTPEVPEVTYSYTQYVFDKGVYTEISSGNSSNNYDIVFELDSENSGELHIKSGDILKFYNKVINHDSNVKARVEGYFEYIPNNGGILCADITSIKIHESSEQFSYGYIGGIIITADIINIPKKVAIYEFLVIPTVEVPSSVEDFSYRWDFYL